VLRDYINAFIGDLESVELETDSIDDLFSEFNEEQQFPKSAGCDEQPSSHTPVTVSKQALVTSQLDVPDCVAGRSQQTDSRTQISIGKDQYYPDSEK